MKLVIKVMWCKGLTFFNFFQKLKIYTIVSIKSDNKTLKLTHHQKQQQKTPVDEEGGGNPQWHHPMTFDISCLESVISSGFDDLLLVFKFRHQQLVGFKSVGEVQVPLRRLIDENGKLISYEVRNPEGKHNGVLDFTYEVIREDVYHIDRGFHSHNHHHRHHYSKHVERKHDAHTDTATTSTSSDKNISEGDRTPLLLQQSWSNPEKIAYPKIDLEGLSDIIPTYLSPNISHRPTPLTVYPPPPAVIQYSLPHPIPTHSPPPPPPYVVYPSSQYGYPPYGDPHCGYYRPPEYNQHG